MSVQLHQYETRSDLLYIRENADSQVLFRVISIHHLSIQLVDICNIDKAHISCFAQQPTKLFSSFIRSNLHGCRVLLHRSVKCHKLIAYIPQKQAKNFLPRIDIYRNGPTPGEDRRIKADYSLSSFTGWYRLLNMTRHVFLQTFPFYNTE